jgi:hypothetical protein
MNLDSITTGWAVVNGMIASLDPRLSFTVLHRSYGKDFYYFRSKGYGANSPTDSPNNAFNKNEKGWYVGMDARLHKNWNLIAHCDIHQFPDLQYLADAPSKGFDGFVQLNYQPFKKTKLYVRYRYKTGEENTSDEVDIDYLESEILQQYRFNITYPVSDAVSLGNRAEYITYRKGSEDLQQGYLIYQDIKYNPKDKPYSFTFRYALFDTESYDTRIYTYEQDIFYYIPYYYMRGMNWYLMGRYRFKFGLDLQFKISRTTYDNRDELLSDLNEIVEGNSITWIKGQVKYRF